MKDKLFRCERPVAATTFDKHQVVGTHKDFGHFDSVEIIGLESGADSPIPKTMMAKAEPF